MGVTEFVMAAVLVDIEAYFGVDAKTAGYLILQPYLYTIPLSRFHRHTQLLINLGIFTLENLIIFFSENFYLTAFARFITGVQHGVFLSLLL